MTANQRYAKAESAAWTGFIGNACLAAVKGGIGLQSGSKTLLTDACRSATDAAASFIALTGVRRCRKLGAPDAPVPVMRGRTEAAAGVMAALFLMIVGLEIGIAAIKSIADGVDESPNWTAAVVVVLAFAVKELLFPVKERRTDLYASLAAIVGTGGAALGRPAGPAAALLFRSGCFADHCCHYFHHRLPCCVRCSEEKQIL